MNSGWALFLVVVLGFLAFFYFASNGKAAMDRKLKYFGDGVDESYSTENSIKKKSKAAVGDHLDYMLETYGYGNRE